MKDYIRWRFLGTVEEAKTLFVSPEFKADIERLLCVVKFTEGTNPMLGIVFDAPHHVAVFNLRLLHNGDIAFGSNSFRAEDYEKPLRTAIAQWEKRQEAT